MAFAAGFLGGGGMLLLFPVNFPDFLGDDRGELLGGSALLRVVCCWDEP